VVQRQTTSRFKPLPDCHRKIAYRLPYIRKCQGVSQARLAADVGLTLAQLANIEAGRVPLRAAAAWKICQHLSVHPQWLFNGHRESAFPELTDTQKNWFDQVVVAHGSQTFWDFWASFGFLFLDDQADYFERVALSGHIPKCDAETEKECLTYISPKSKCKGVKSEIQKLIDRVKRKASKPGAKAELARTLSVAPARITEWLSGKKESGGEYTLRLQKWVEQQERQK